MTSQILIQTVQRQFMCWPKWPVLMLAALIGLMLLTVPLPLAVLLLSGTVIILISLIQPLFALGLAIIAAPFGALESALLGGVALDSGQVLLLIAIGTWIVHGMIRKEFQVPTNPLLIPLLVFIAIASFSLLLAADVLLGLIEVLKWVEVLVILVMVFDLGAGRAGENVSALSETRITSTKRIWWLAACLLLAGFVQASIGIWQFAFRGDGPAHFLVLDRFYRAYGTFEQPNPFGGYMSMSALLAIGITLGLIATSFGAWTDSRRQVDLEDSHDGVRHMIAAAVVGSIALVSLLGLVFSWSRGAWMGFVAGLAAMVVFWPRRLRSGILLLLLAAVLFLVLYQTNLLPNTIVGRIGGFVSDLSFGDVRGIDINDANYAILERLAHWQAALDMARDRPWLGVGFGNYGTVYSTYALLNWPDALGHAHNYYINLLAEVGFLGFAAYLLLWIVIVWQTVKVLNHAFWPLRGVVLGLLGVWIAISVHHLVDKLYVNNVYISLGVLLGLLQLTGLRSAAALSRMKEL